MHFAIFESGSKGNCFLLKDEHTSILIDCGGTKRCILDSLAATNTTMEDIDAVLITHDHTDHIARIALVADRTIYSPVSIKGISTIPVVPGESFSVEHLTITPIALSHDAEHTTGYIIKSFQETLVYVTDTGYIRDAYLPLMKGADYIVLESNHDVEMLMKTSRPMFLKMRIAGDNGHLCNEDCAAILKKIVTSNTKMIILAHISEQANTRERALEVSGNMLEHHPDRRNGLILCSAAQNELIKGGDWPNEKVDGGSCSRIFTVERMAHTASL